MTIPRRNKNGQTLYFYQVYVSLYKYASRIAIHPGCFEVAYRWRLKLEKFLGPAIEKLPVRNLQQIIVK